MVYPPVNTMVLDVMSTDAVCAARAGKVSSCSFPSTTRRQVPTQSSQLHNTTLYRLVSHTYHHRRWPLAWSGVPTDFPDHR